jgi:hypothetical protein
LCGVGQMQFARLSFRIYQTALQNCA